MWCICPQKFFFAILDSLLTNAFCTEQCERKILCGSNQNNKIEWNGLECFIDMLEPNEINNAQKYAISICVVKNRISNETNKTELPRSISLLDFLQNPFSFNDNFFQILFFFKISSLSFPMPFFAKYNKHSNKTWNA